MRLYQECATVADKYLKFQLKWHQHCNYLVDCNRELSLIGLHPNDPIAVDVASVWSQWHCVVKQYSLTKDDSKIFLILFLVMFTVSSCILIIQPLRLVSLLHSCCPKTVMMYIIAAISSMLHSRYTPNLVLCITTKRVSLELSVLQKLSIHNKEEKTHIPSYLKYRDNGYMYFPYEELMPFLKPIDAATVKNCTDESFKHCGSELLTTLAVSVENNANLWSIFVNAVVGNVSELQDVSLSCLDRVFKELICKVCHTRIQEYLDSFNQIEAASKGNVTLAGQILRDSLLSNHINLKSKIK